MLFKKAAVFTDLHMGEHNDEERFNQDCHDFLDWFVSEARRLKCDRVIFLGDWWHNRFRLSSETLASGTLAFRKLLALGLPIDIIVGNHDMPRKAQRDINTCAHFGFSPLVTIRDKVEVDGGVAWVPYLVGAEHAIVPTLKAPYLFGHLELPLFLTNQTQTFHDGGGLHMDHFIDVERILTGHFHKRQLKRNKHGIPIWYIGSPFGHNFNDMGDRQKGFCTIVWGEDPVFHDYADGPRYDAVDASVLLEYIEQGAIPKLLSVKSFVEVVDDIGLSEDDRADIKAIVKDHVRSFRFRNPPPEETGGETTEAEQQHEDINDHVKHELQQYTSPSGEIDAKLLIEIYEGTEA